MIKMSMGGRRQKPVGELISAWIGKGAKQKKKKNFRKSW
jgi:hypothetical protein